ncbi:unnamed protein product [Brachionus calyciflorus]|uniref:Uncharacterized protein n=1 Tax=Brachionus calyciflorus TaxID=104777 RepID=A0A813TUU3_9BILA|nr:unnamed protein product [Brachionus calyciflorus]
MHLKEMRGVTRAYLASYLDEFCWRKINCNSRVDTVEAILSAISVQFKDQIEIDLAKGMENLSTDDDENEEEFDADDPEKNKRSL